jgi:hypothetical protein
MNGLTDPKDEIAKRYGFKSYAELLAKSDRLPKLPGDTSQSYVARHPRGYWFVWEEKPHAKDEHD